MEGGIMAPEMSFNTESMLCRPSDDVTPVMNIKSDVLADATGDFQYTEEDEIAMREANIILPSYEDLLRLAELSECPPELSGIQEEKPW